MSIDVPPILMGNGSLIGTFIWGPKCSGDVIRLILQCALDGFPVRTSMGEVANRRFGGRQAVTIGFFLNGVRLAAVR